MSIKSSLKEKSLLQSVWNGVMKEFTNYRENTLGQILTIIDATIVDKQQNKSIKDLIRNVVWRNEYTERNIANWLLWFQDNYDITRSETMGSSEPMKYDGVPFGNLLNYKK